jgi:hypothetical protein
MNRQQTKIGLDGSIEITNRGNSVFFQYFFFDYRGCHKKVRQISMSMKSLYDGNFGSIESKRIFEHWTSIETRKDLQNDIIFVMRHFFPF